MVNMKVLFICTQNLLRSPTAEALYRSRPELEVRSTGIATDARVLIREELLQWAEIVFVMEERHRLYLHHHFPVVAKVKRIVCLNIPDNFCYMDPELVRILTKKLQPYLGESGLEP